MTDEKRLRALARAALQAGRLPKVRPERIWGGPGAGARCAVCDGTIDRDQSEFELEFAGKIGGEPAPSPFSDEHAGGTFAEGGYHLHVGCFAAWEFERQTRQQLQGRSRDGMIRPDERDTAKGTKVNGANAGGASAGGAGADGAGAA